MMKMKRFIVGTVLAVLFAALPACAEVTGTLENDFQTPPRSAGVRCYWLWLNGNITKEGITRDLEAMRAKGFSGAMVCDVTNPAPDNRLVPGGIDYMSKEWREMLQFAVEEADRLDLELSLSIVSGWVLGGPMVTPKDAAKKVTWSETRITGPVSYQEMLPDPDNKFKYHEDIAVLAYPVPKAAAGSSKKQKTKPIRDLPEKTMVKLLGIAGQDSRHLLEDKEYKGELPDVHVADIVDISDKMDAKGLLRWEVPEGEWVVLRFSAIPTGVRVRRVSPKWNGLAVDYMDPSTIQLYWDSAVAPVLEDVKPHLGKTLRYLHIDSWEGGGTNWTRGLRQKFRERRGYDLLPYLPVLAGKIVENRQASNSFLADYRKTLAVGFTQFYETFSSLAGQFGLGIHPESGGPHSGPFDALETLGRSNIPMGEFWAPSPHRPRPEDRFYVKQASSAAHIYGKPLVAAEGFTTVGTQWNDVPWQLKASFDHEICSGLNMLFMHTFDHSPAKAGLPGQAYFAGTHLNRNITWWDQSKAFFDYLNRCQFLMRQGTFQADVVYYSGDQIPNLVQLKEADPADVLPGYDYDVTNEEALLRYASVKDGKIVYSTGMTYRLLVLPDHRVLSYAALNKVEELVRDGATVLGYKPQKAVTLSKFPDPAKTFKGISDAVWGTDGGDAGSHQYGQGRVIWGKTARQVLSEMKIAPDLEFDAPVESLDFVHRTFNGREVYFVSNQTPDTLAVTATFRVNGRQPELWDAVTGKICDLKAFTQKNGRTSIPLAFEPYGSIFVIFDAAIPTANQGTATVNTATDEPLMEVNGPWTVSFDPAWGGPEKTEFESLISWTEHPQSQVRHYSGKATYRKTVSMNPSEGLVYILELGRVEDVGIAQVRLNGKDMGVLWTPPFRVDITGALKTGENLLEIDVVNSWRNRLVADEDLPKDKRLTKTNIPVSDRLRWGVPQKPLASGLLGPVRIFRQKVKD